MDFPDCPDRAPKNVRLCEIGLELYYIVYIAYIHYIENVDSHFVQTPDGLELSVNSLPHLIIVLSPDPPVHS